MKNATSKKSMMKTYTLIKGAALAVPAAALMLGSSQAGTSVGINFQGSAYGTSGKEVTATAFGIGASDWFTSANPGLAADSLTATPSNGGSFGVSWSAQGVWTSWAAPVYMPIDYVGYPGDTEVYWGELYGPYQVNLSGLAAQFPDGYVLQAIAADDGRVPQIAPTSISDGVTPETLTYDVRGTFTYNASAGFSISTPTSNLFTSDTLSLTGPSDGIPRSFLAGFIITDKPVVTVPPKGASLASGGTITMNAGAVGVAPLTYQWRKGGVDLSGATSATYTNALTEVGDSGDYDVVVTNLYGTATSPVAAVTVAVPATVTWDADAGTSDVQDGDGTWTSANWWDGLSDIAWSNFNFVTFGSGGIENYTVTLPSAVIAGRLTFNANYAVSGSGSITLNSPTIAANSNATLNVPLLGTSGLTKVGAGTVTLGATNIYTGNTTVNEGTLSVTGANGALGAGTVTVGASGTLSFATTGGRTLANTIGGAGTIHKSDDSRYTFAGNISGFTGTYTQSAGQTCLSAANSGSADAGWVFNGTYFVSHVGNATLELGALSGSALHWNDSTSGTTTLEIGALGTSTTYSGNIGVGSNGAATALTKVGSGTLTLTASNGYTGPTTVNNGALLVTGSIATGTVTVNANATLGGTGTIHSTTTIADNGRLAFTLSTLAADHDPLNITAALVFSGASVLDITTSGVLSAPGIYPLVVASEPITGSVPAILNLPAGWAATVSISEDTLSLLLTVTSTGTSPYDSWSNGTFANSFTDKVASHDPDGDGLTNLQEYAFGTDPTLSSSGAIVYDGTSVTNPGAPKIVEDGGAFYAVFGRRADYLTAGILYTVRFSADLEAGYWETSATEPSELTSTGDIRAVRVPYPIELIPSANGPQKARFFQVGVEQTP